MRDGAFILVGASLVGTALIPQIGGHIGAEYNAITFVLGLCAPLITFQRSIVHAAKPWLRAIPAKALPFAGASAAAIMVLVNGVGLVATAQASERTEYAPELGFFVTPEFKADTLAMRKLALRLDEEGVPKNRQVLSVYTSALDVAAGTKSPAPVGSLIHALGETNRRQFNALVEERQVAAVTSIAPDYSGWEGWNLRANWPFFRALRENYHPIARNDQHIVWGIGPSNSRKENAQCAITHAAMGTMEVSLSAQRSGLASLRLERPSAAPGSRGQMLTVTEDSPFTRSAKGEVWGGFPRYGVANASVIEVPAPLVAGEITKLTFNVLDGSDIGAATCSASVYASVDFAALPSMSEGIDAYLGTLRP